VSALVAQAPTFSTRVELVRIDALVTDGARPVLGLGADDFEVFDNGARQSIEHVSFDTVPVNLVLALDMSESVKGPLLVQLRTAGSAAMAGLRDGDQAALLTFSHVVHLAVPLTGNVVRVRDGLDAAAAGGGTALIDGALASLGVGESDPARGVVIVFSDGRDTASFLSGDRVLQAARRSDRVVYGVTTDGRRSNEFLSDLAEVTGGRVFDAADGASLARTFAAVLQEFRQRYLISYTPRGVMRPGWHAIEVRVKGRRLKIAARAGYLAGPE
jgi:VWFA-related protein